MSPADRNKVLIAGGVALVAVVIIAFFLMRGRGRSAPGDAGAGGFGAVPGAAVETGAAAPGAVAPGEAAPAAPGEAAEGEQIQVAEAGPMVGVVRMGTGATEPTRPDPFLTFDPPPQPTPPEILVQLPPVGLVAGGLRPGGAAVTVARVANRRVAGLLFNDQAWAILEDENGETFVVKPGDVVDGIRITAISRDSIFLRDREGQRWEVPLRGIGPGGRSAAAGTSVSAVPGLPPA